MADTINYETISALASGIETAANALKKSADRQDFTKMRVFRGNLRTLTDALWEVS